MPITLVKKTPLAGPAPATPPPVRLVAKRPLATPVEPMASHAQAPDLSHAPYRPPTPPWQGPPEGAAPLTTFVSRAPEGPNQPAPGRMPVPRENPIFAPMSRATGLERGEAERTTWDMVAEAPARIPQSLGAGFERQFEAGAWNFIAGAAENLGLDSVAEFYKKAGAEATALGNAIAPSTRNLGFTEAAAYSGVESIGGSAPSLASGVVLGPTGALALMGATSAGIAYAEGTRQGLDPRTNAVYSVTEGLIEALTERIPATKLLDDVLKGSGFGKTIFRQLREELVNEQFATFFSDLNGWVTLPENAEKPLAAFMAERPSAIAQTFIATLTSTVGQSTGAVALGKLARLKAEQPAPPPMAPPDAPSAAAPPWAAPTTVEPQAAQEAAPVTPEAPAATPVDDGMTLQAGITDDQRAQLEARGFNPDAMTIVDAQEVLRQGIPTERRSVPRGVQSAGDAPMTPEGRSAMANAYANDPAQQAAVAEMQQAKRAEAPPRDAIDTDALLAEADALDASADGPTLEVIEDDGVTENASGESAASAEAIRRQRDMKAAGTIYAVYDKAGNKKTLIGPEAVDYNPAKGETYGIEGPSGFQVLTDNGGKVPSRPASAQAKSAPPWQRKATENATAENDRTHADDMASLPGHASMPPPLLAVVRRLFPNREPSTMRVTAPGVLTFDATLEGAPGFTIDLNGAAPTVTPFGAKDKQVSNYMREVFAKAIKANPGLRALATPVDTPAPQAQTGTSDGAATDPRTANPEGPAGDARQVGAPPRVPGRARRGDAHPNEARAPLYKAALAAARAVDPAVDRKVVRREFDARMDLHDDAYDAEDAANADPRTLLKEIARKGGIHEKDNGQGQAGELRRLRAGQAFGNIGGIPGVLATKPKHTVNVRVKIDGKWEIRQETRGGYPLDVMLQDLQADGRWPWLESIDDLTDFLDDIQKHGVPERGARDLKALGMDPATKWWETSFGPQDADAGIDESATDDGDTDFSFDDAPTAADRYVDALAEDITTRFDTTGTGKAVRAGTSRAPRPFTTENLADVFGITEEQSVAVMAIVKAMGLPVDRIVLVKGDPNETVGDDALAQSPTRLSVLHNLSAENLAFADRMGGLPSPSLAVVTPDADHDGYGEITLIGQRQLADPQREPVFDADAYTGRAPKPQYPPVKTAVAQPFYNALRPWSNEFDDYHGETWDDLVNNAKPEAVITRMARGPAAAAWYLKDVLGVEVKPVREAVEATFPWTALIDKATAEPLIDDALTHDPTRNAELRTLILDAVDRFLASPKGVALAATRSEVSRQRGKKSDREWVVSSWGADSDWVSDPSLDVPFRLVDHIRDDIRKRGQTRVNKAKTNARVARALKGHEGAFAKWVDDKVWAMFGPPYIKVDGRKVPYTLSNIVDASISARIAGKEDTMTFGEGKARATVATRFSDVEHMRNAADAPWGIRSDKQVTEAREAAQKLTAAWRDQVIRHYQYDDTWGALDASMRAIARWARGGRTTANLSKALRAEGFKTGHIGLDVLEDGVEAGKAMLGTPVPYFEAKPQRAVKLDEFAGAVIPAKASAETKALLEKHGIPYATYSGRGRATDARKRAVQKLTRQLSKAGKETLFQNGSLFDEDENEFGEAQKRLPGDVGAVRDEERPTPKVSDEPEFRLTSEVSTRKAKQNVLFQSGDAKAVLPAGFWYFDNILSALPQWQGKGTPEQLLAHLKKTKGAMDEAGDIGLTAWLEGKRSVTRDEVTAFVEAHKVQVEEKTLGKEPTAQDIANLADKLWNEEVARLMESRDMTRAEAKASLDKDDFYAQADEQLTGGGTAQYAGYQLDGPKANYREILLSLPPQRTTAARRVEVRREAGNTAVMLFYDGKFVERYADKPGAKPVAQTPDDEWTRVALRHVFGEGGKPLQTADYEPPHFGETNLLLHLRVNDRTLADGRKVLFAEEMQSDWHQAGRKKGYIQPVGKPTAEGLAARKAVFDRYTERLAAVDRDIDSALPSQLRDARARRDRLETQRDQEADAAYTLPQDTRDRESKAGVPDAPFKDAGWKKLALKRLLAYAAEGGYDGIAWTTGEQQAARYDLSKQIKSLDYEAFESDDADVAPVGTRLYEVVAKGLDGRTVFEQDEMTAADIEATFGKEIAQKLEASEGAKRTDAPARSWRRLEGLDLKVGGEGMKGFYDRELPNLANDLAKKFGQRVEKGAVNTAPENRMRSRQYRYDGPEASANAIESAAKEAEPSIRRQLLDVATRVRDGRTVSEAMLSFGSPAAAEAIGGTLDFVYLDDPNAPVHVLATPAAMRDEIRAKGFALFQRQRGANGTAKGSVQFLEDGKALVAALTDPNVSTPLHEVGHIGRRFLLNRDVPAEMRQGISDEDLDTTEDFLGLKRGALTTDIGTPAEEKYARAFEHFLRTGGPSLPSSIREVFAKVAKWLTEVYQTIKGSPIDVEITPAMRTVFDRLVTRQERLAAESAAKAEPVKSGPPKAAPVEDEAVTAELREDLGVPSQAFIDAYDPQKAVKKAGRGWSYVTLGGVEWQGTMPTRREALAAAERHKAIKQEQFDNPESFRDITSVRARKRIAIAQKLMDGGMSEMAAYAEAKKRLEAKPSGPPKRVTVDKTSAGDQTRLPGDVGDVRDEERAQPTEDVPEQSLSLRSQQVEPEQAGLGLGPIGRIEQKARARMKDRGTTDVLFQSDEPLPLSRDDRDDLVVIGAAKLARGLDRKAWDAAMRREFGSRVTPFLDALHTQASTRAKVASEIDIDDYFNFKRIHVSADEKAELSASIIETIYRTGRVPKERESWATIRNEAAQMGPEAVAELKPFQEMQAPFRAVRDAARRRINVLNQEIVEGRKALAGIPEEETIVRERVLNQKEQDVRGLLDTWMRMRSEDGRNLAMHRMTVDSMETWYDATFWLSKAKREMGLPHGVELPVDVFRRLQDILNRGKQAVETGRPPEPIQLELSRYLASLQKNTLLETIAALRKAGLLTGIKTHMRNVGGNLAFAALEELSRAPAAVIDMVLAAATGHRTVHGISVRAVGAASMEAATKGVSDALDVLRDGQTVSDLARTDHRREHNSGYRLIDAYINYTFRALSAMDRVFRSYAFRRSMEEQAMLEAVNNGVSPVELLAKPTQAMVARAIADAEFATFNNQNVVATAMSHMKGSLKREAGAGGKTAAFVIDLAVPFVNTPSNIVARMFDYSPVGVAKTVGKAAIRATIDKGMTAEQQRLFTLGMGRGMTGSALIYLGWTLAAAGLASGLGGGDDEGDRNVRDAAGILSGAIKVGGRWHQIASFSPAGNLVSLGATIQRTATQPFRKEALRTPKLIGIGAKLVLEQPMLKGMADIVDALQRPESAGESVVTSTIGSFVPTFMNDIASAYDPYRRDARPKKNQATGVWTGFISRFPGARNTLPARIDVFGEKQAQTAVAIWSPTIATVARDMTDPVLRELIKTDTGISWPRQGKDESADAYQQRIVKTGEAIKARVARVITAPAYQRLTLEQKAERLEDVITEARRSVRIVKVPPPMRPRFQ